MPNTLLRYALLAGTVYFAAMAAAHFFGLKMPVLFVYYDTPYHAYQDKIISFAVVSYAALFLLAARQCVAVPTALFVLGVTVAGLASVNLSSALGLVLQPGQSTLPYWLQTGLVALYLVVLLVLYHREPRAG